MAQYCQIRPHWHADTHVKNAQLVTNLQQTCSKSAQQLVDRMCSHWLSQACWQGCYKPAADLLQAWWTQQPCYKFVPTTCYRAASQQLVNKLWVTNLVQLDKITALLYKLVDKLVTSLLRAQLVDKLCVFTCVEVGIISILMAWHCVKDEKNRYARGTCICASELYINWKDKMKQISQMEANRARKTHFKRTKENFQERENGKRDFQTCQHTLGSSNWHTIFQGPISV